MKTVTPDTNVRLTAPCRAKTEVAGFINRPPPTSLPPIPDDFQPLSSLLFRGKFPRPEELAALGDVLEEMARFTDFEQLLGTGVVLPHAVTLGLMTSAHEWSTLRRAVRESEVFCHNQEARAWVQLRLVLERVRIAFRVAAANDVSLAEKYPALVRLLEAGKVIGQRAAATRKANDAEVAAGRAPHKGRVGQARRRKAAAAALLAEGALAKDGEK